MGEGPATPMPVSRRKRTRGKKRSKAETVKATEKRRGHRARLRNVYKGKRRP